MTIKLRSLLEENNILVPRNLDSRIEKQKQIDIKRIQEYIKNGSKGDLDLSSTSLTKLPDNLIIVGEDLVATDSNIESLNNLEYVGGGLYMKGSKLKSLPPKLTQIGKILYIVDNPINNLDNLKYVGRNLYIGGTNISELPEGLRISGYLVIGSAPLKKRFSNKTSFMKYLEKRNIKVGGEFDLRGNVYF